MEADPIVGWDGHPPLAHPDTAKVFSCTGAAPFNVENYACHFTFFGDRHDFTAAEIVSINYDGDGDTQQWFVPCDPAPALCVPVAPPALDTLITSGPAGVVRATCATFGFTSTRASSIFQCRLDGRSWQSCGSPKRYFGLSDGRHLFEVRAGDLAGNLDATPAARRWRVDTHRAEDGARSADCAPVPARGRQAGSPMPGRGAGRSLHGHPDSQDGAKAAVGSVPQGHLRPCAVQHPERRACRRFGEAFTAQPPVGRAAGRSADSRDGPGARSP